MAKFLAGSELNTELEKIFENAERDLILISPYNVGRRGDDGPARLVIGISKAETISTNESNRKREVHNFVGRDT